jgi:DNA-binding response OmpR family regulator
MTTQENRRVLLVDDDPEVREAVAMFLRDKGYQVYQEADGSGAFDRFDHSSPFVFVISDFQFFPGQRVSSCGSKIRHGADLVREIRKLNPTQRMAIMTGDDHAAMKELDASVKDVPLLRKPFGMQELLALIDKA